MPENFTSDNFVDEAIDAVLDARDEWGSKKKLTEDDLFVVWFNFTLGNWKALVSTHKLANTYWEVTYDKMNEVTYVDWYVKQDQAVFPDEE